MILKKCITIYRASTNHNNRYYHEGNMCNIRNKLPVAIFAAREMLVICAKYNNNNYNS